MPKCCIKQAFAVIIRCRCFITIFGYSLYFYLTCVRCIQEDQNKFYMQPSEV